jgi:hypothetical protein
MSRCQSNWIFSVAVPTKVFNNYVGGHNGVHTNGSSSCLAQERRRTGAVFRDLSLHILSELLEDVLLLSKGCMWFRHVGAPPRF